jgi:hypothetical protein
MHLLLSNKEIISILLGALYAYLYSLTIRKIIKDCHNVSSISFTWFALTNLWLGISNWYHIGSIGYFIAFFMWIITVAVNEIVKLKIKKWVATPKVNNFKI